MISKTLPSFWKGYERLDKSSQRQARKAFKLWRKNPSHPSLRFKRINKEENIWSARVSIGCRAVGIWDDEIFTWIWIGNHDEYEAYFG